jgi:SAM-dependent methyltransferase
VLNPGFSFTAEEAYGREYVLPQQLVNAVLRANAEAAAGSELRTQAVYGDELRFRLGELGLEDLPLENLAVLDACCGSGFLSYHLLQRAAPRLLTLLDVSWDELRSAERLIEQTTFDSSKLRVECGDLAGDALHGAQFDLVIGNSFLHHLPDVPGALQAIFRLTRPGGWFVGLHEPTPAALAWESGDPRQAVEYFLFRDRYFKRIRPGENGLVREGTTDVWLFRPEELRALLTEAGFTEVDVIPRYLLRPFFIALFKLHLNEARPRLTRVQAGALRAMIRLDAQLRRFLPARVFGGLSLAARRPLGPHSGADG